MVIHENKEYSSLSEIADEIDPFKPGEDQRIAHAAEKRINELLDLYLKTKRRDAQVRSWERDLEIVLEGIDRLMVPGLFLLPHQRLLCEQYTKKKPRVRFKRPVVGANSGQCYLRPFRRR